MKPCLREFRGFLQIGAGLGKLAQRQFAMAAFGVQRGVGWRSGDGAGQRLNGFAILPDGYLRLREFEEQIRILRVGLHVFPGVGDRALVVGQRVELRAGRRGYL